MLVFYALAKVLLSLVGTLMDSAYNRKLREMHLIRENPGQSWRKKWLKCEWNILEISFQHLNIFTIELPTSESNEIIDDWNNVFDDVE